MCKDYESYILWFRHQRRHQVNRQGRASDQEDQQRRGEELWSQMIVMLVEQTILVRFEWFIVYHMAIKSLKDKR